MAKSFFLLVASYYFWKEEEGERREREWEKMSVMVTTWRKMMLNSDHDDNYGTTRENGEKRMAKGKRVKWKLFVDALTNSAAAVL